jgi:20S proteasome alpha/beta subunit
MTVCIATLCNETKDIVVASDRMITATYPPVEFEHGTPKIEVICPSCVVLTAGDALAHADICRAVREIVAGLSRPKTAVIKEHIRVTYVAERQKVISQRFLEPRGWTLDDFYEKYARTIHPDLMLTIDREISTYDYGLEIIVAGVDSDEGHIYGIRHPGEVDCYDALGYHTIGIGDLHAVSSLIGNKCIPSVSRKMAVYLVYEAKKNAENAPGVGRDTDMVIINKDGHQILNNEELSLLNNIYDSRRVPQTAEFIKAVDDLPF